MKIEKDLLRGSLQLEKKRGFCHRSSLREDSIFSFFQIGTMAN